MAVPQINDQGYALAMFTQRRGEIFGLMFLSFRHDPKHFNWLDDSLKIT